MKEIAASIRQSQSQVERNETGFNPWEFIHTEYSMDALIQEFPKPIISLVHGFCMGGGAGVGFGAHFVCFDETTKFAMPELQANWVPDCGSSSFLNNPSYSSSRKFVAEYLTLTGRIFDASDVYFSGFSKFHVPRSSMQGLKRSLKRLKIGIGDPFQIVEDTILPFCEDLMKPSYVQSVYPHIQRCFSKASVKEIKDALQSCQDQHFKRDCLDRMNRVSPLLAEITLKLQKHAQGNPFPSLCCQREYLSNCLIGCWAEYFGHGVQCFFNKIPITFPTVLDHVIEDVTSILFSNNFEEIRAHALYTRAIQQYPDLRLKLPALKAAL